VQLPDRAGRFWHAADMKTCLFLIVVAFSLFRSSAFADCVNPAGREGGIVYNSTYKVAQFCNGIDWISMAGGASTSVSGGGIPSGFIGAFDLASCPDGWSEYALARGRFLRGIDSTGTIDPSGTRIPGNTQEDAIRNITGSFTTYYNSNNVNASDLFHGVASNGKGTLGSGSGYYVNQMTFDASSVVPTAPENRPKNVAVLFCKKD
jgi:hypothetical protein